MNTRTAFAALRQRAENQFPLTLRSIQKQFPISNATWSDFDSKNFSYEIVAPGTKETDPQKVYARCRIHGFAVYVDGHVSMDRKTTR